MTTQNVYTVTGGGGYKFQNIPPPQINWNRSCFFSHKYEQAQPIVTGSSTWLVNYQIKSCLHKMFIFSVLTNGFG